MLSNFTSSTWLSDAVNRWNAYKTTIPKVCYYQVLLVSDAHIECLIMGSKRGSLNFSRCNATLPSPSLFFAQGEWR